MNLKCLQCNKQFANLYNLNRHKKIPCNLLKETTNCDICNINFSRPAEYKRHEKTKRHITNNIINIDNSTTNNINQIINLLCPVNTFINTNINCLNNLDINKCLEGSDKIINDVKLDIEEDVFTYDLKKETIIRFMNYLIKIFSKLNFNKDHTFNNNCKILIFIKDNVKPIIIKSQYLILETRPNNKFQWTEIIYTRFINELLNLMILVKTYFNIDNLNYIVDFLEEYFKNNENIQNELKDEIITSLLCLTKTFTYDSNDMDLQYSLKNYIEEETKLPNGIDSNVKYIANLLENSN